MENEITEEEYKRGKRRILGQIARDSKPHEAKVPNISKEDKLYQGPVRPTDDEEVFRKTGKTVQLKEASIKKGDSKFTKKIAKFLQAKATYKHKAPARATLNVNKVFNHHSGNDSSFGARSKFFQSSWRTEQKSLFLKS